MNKATKVICMVAGAMIAFGLIMAGVGFCLGAETNARGPWGVPWSDEYYDDESYFDSPEMTKISETLEPFSSIDLDVDWQVVELRPGEGYSIYSSYNPKYGTVAYQLENGRLTVAQTLYARKWNFFNERERYAGKLVITYPAGSSMEEVTVSGGMGDISAETLTARRLEIDASLGVIMLSDVNASSLDLDASMGDIEMDRVTCDTAVINCEMGAIESDDFTCRNGLEADAAMGDIELSGDFRGRTDINCNMGSVTVDLAGARQEYSYDLSVAMGSIEINGEDRGHSATGTSGDGGSDSLQVSSDMGDIEINFSN